MPIVTFLTWKDACMETADESTFRPVNVELSLLHEIGFLMGETDEAVTIGMEMAGDDTQRGRWRLTVPKNGIVERRDMQLEKAFPPRRRRSK